MKGDEIVEIEERDLATFYELKKDSRFAVIELIVLKFLLEKFGIEKLYPNFYGFDYAVEISSQRGCYILVECKVGKPLLREAQWEGIAELVGEGKKIRSVWIFATEKHPNTVIYNLIKVLETPIGEVYVYDFDYVKYLQNTRDFIVNAIMEDVIDKIIEGRCRC